jgi:hypothetical protein
MMNWKGFGWKRSWPILRYYPSTRLECLKNTKILDLDSQSSGRGLYPGSSKYEAGVLTAQKLSVS